MPIRIEPYTTGEQAAGARVLNDRLRAHHHAEFLLSELPPAPPAPAAAVRNHHYIVHEDSHVRGGFLLAEFPAEFGDGRRMALLNAREPLSEAIIDPRYSLLALRILKFMESQGPYLFALGMGSESRPFPRLLKSAHWEISRVPFLFRVVRAGRFLAEIQPLQSSPLRRLAAAAARFTGAGALGIAFLQHRALLASASSASLTIEPVAQWDTWVDDVWAEFRPHFSLAVTRDLHTVRELYPLDGRHPAYLLRHRNRPVAWMAARLTRMRNDQYFGNLHVATVLDGIGSPEYMLATAALVSRTLVKEGVDLLLTNQSHKDWIAAFRSAGYLNGPSNYILALSKQLAAEVAAQPEGPRRMHFTRGDSDGRDHL